MKKEHVFTFQYIGYCQSICSMLQQVLVSNVNYPSFINILPVVIVTTILPIPN